MKVVILTCRIGEGHNSVARAILGVLKGRNIECEIKDTFSFFGEKASVLVNRIVVNLVIKTPRVYGLMYRLGDSISSNKRKSPIYFLNKIYANNLYRYITENGFDTVICPHLFPAEALTYLKSKYNLNVRCYFISTDYTCIPFLEDLDMDGIFVPHEDLKNEFLRRGIPEKELFCTGIPVSCKYITNISMEAARKIIGIPTNIPVYLVMTGGEGYGDAVTLTRKLLEKSHVEDIRVVVLVGRNNTLYREMNMRFVDDKRVMVVSFTEQVQTYMAACNVLITKPGGVTSTEAAVKNVPLIHISPIPGCEAENAHFFSKRGMSILADDYEAVAINAIRLAFDKDIALRICEAQCQNINKNAAEDICNIIYN